MNIQGTMGSGEGSDISDPVSTVAPSTIIRRDSGEYGFESTSPRDEVVANTPGIITTHDQSTVTMTPSATPLVPSRSADVCGNVSYILGLDMFSMLYELYRFPHPPKHVHIYTHSYL